MDGSLKLQTIISNAFNMVYTAGQYMDNLERLMNEATLLEMRHCTDSSEYTEIQRLIPIQENLAQAKLEGHPIFDQPGILKLTAQEDA